MSSFFFYLHPPSPPSSLSPLSPFHLGDFAYNLETENSANGNFFMNRAMLYATNQPVQPACGNQ